MADALGQPDSDALMAAVATAGRTVAWEGDDAWRRRGAWQRSKKSGRSGRRSEGRGRSSRPDGEVTPPAGDPDIGLTEDEVVLTPAADVTGDPSLSLRLAAVAAERNLPIARQALNLLARKAPTPPEPWSDDLRATLVRVLATGPPAIAALEALDQRHLLERYLPEWASVRNKPQRNPYHRFTVDRHLLEATANAATLAHRVSRADLLLLGSLLHDIGKGFPGDHTEVGMAVVADIGSRIGLPPEDVDTLVTMVRLHLLLPDTATRRDLDDPATAERVAKEVGSRSTLELLAALVEADSQATGPSAWGPWKAGLVAELVERTGRLAGRRARGPPDAMDHRRPPGHHGDGTGPRGPRPLGRRPHRDRGGPGPPGTLRRGDRGPGPPWTERALGGGGRRGRRGRRDLHRRAGPGPLAGRRSPDRRPGRRDERVAVHRAQAGRAGPDLPQRAPGGHASPGVHPGQRGQQRLGHGIGGRGAGRGRGRPAPPDHPGTGRLPARRHLGQGLHLRFGGRRRLLRPRARTAGS